ncbi:hypothetical protein MAHJHV33_48630 [Mycobacterium avium subsp. hominissuis]
MAAPTRPAAALTAAVFDAGTHQLAVLAAASDPASVTLFGDSRGTVYLATRGGYFVLDLATGRVVRVAR